MKITGFCDLNISISPQQLSPSNIQDIISLGYKNIALNTTVEEESIDLPKKKKNVNKEIIPAPKSCSAETCQKASGKLNLLQRLTVNIYDANQLQRVCKSENTKKYDIVAVIPRSTNAFQLACACKEIDLISFDANNHLVHINRKNYNLAVSNGIYFEVPYAPAIADSGQRKNTIQIAHSYHTYGKSKNVVITSGATEIFRLRGPYDVVNLGLLFGLSEEQAKHSMLNTARALILRAEGRRFGKTAMTMMITDLGIESEEESDDEPVAKKSKKTTPLTETEMSVS